VVVFYFIKEFVKDMFYMREKADTRIFSDLKERELRKEGILIGEGRLVAERMLSSGLKMIAVLCTEELAGRFLDLAGGRCPVIVRPASVIEEIAGFHFHRGVMAAADRPRIMDVGEYISINPRISNSLICPALEDVENLGSIARSASAFGYDTLIIGDKCCDPYSRKALRTSMGAVFSLQILRIGKPEEFRPLRKRGYHLFAATTSPNAISISDIIPPLQYALLFGNEYKGLDESWLSFCDAELTIPISQEVDSLNVGVAAGIFLYYFSLKSLR
jgi:TrmH family RNA methyltransferase